MKRRLAALSALSFAVAGAQDAAQNAIMEKIYFSFEAVYVPCPLKSKEGGKKPICLALLDMTPRQAAKALSGKFGKQLSNPPGWSDLDPVFLNAWDNGQYLYPMSLEPDDDDTLLVIGEQAAPTGAFSGLPKTVFPSKAAALKAGATRGAAYAALPDFSQVLSFSYKAPYYDLKVNGKTLTFKVGDKRATVGRDVVMMSGAPFVSGGKTYAPVSLLRHLGCALDLPTNEAGNKTAFLVTCLDRGRTRTGLFHNWAP